MIGINFLRTLKGLEYNDILYNIGKTKLEGYFDFIVGRSACEACSETGNFGTDSAFYLAPRETTESLN
jgi:hypothetical protein